MLVEIPLDQRLRLDAGRYVVLKDEAGEQRIGIRAEPPAGGLRLEAGDHLQPGARYVLDRRDLTIGKVAVVIGGDLGARRVEATYAEHARPEQCASLVWDGIDSMRGLAAHSSLDHLGFELSATTAGPAVLSARLELDWLQADLEVRIDGTGADQHLDVEVSVRGRGRWRPVISPVLHGLAPWIRRRLPDQIERLAEDVSAFTSDLSNPDGTAVRDVTQRRIWARQEESDRNRAERFEALHDRFATIQDRIDAMPWWRRRERAWRREVAVLKEPPGVRGIWSELATDGFDEATYAGFIESHLRAVPRSRRREVLRQTVDEMAAPHPHRPLADVPRSIPPPSTAVLDDLVDLAWLASPLGAIRHVFSLDSDAEAKDLLADLARAPER